MSLKVKQIMQAIAGFMSVTQAAPEVGMTRQSFWQQIRSGSIKAMKIGETYVIPMSEVRRIRKTRISKIKMQLSSLEKRERAGN